MSTSIAGYGDCGTGYICPENAYSEGGYEPTDANVKPESERLVKKGVQVDDLRSLLTDIKPGSHHRDSSAGA